MMNHPNSATLLIHTAQWGIVLNWLCYCRMITTTAHMFNHHQITTHNRMIPGCTHRCSLMEQCYLIPCSSLFDKYFVEGLSVGFTYGGYAQTVYPKKYAHGFCFAVLCCGYTLTDFPISIRLTSLALWQSNDCPSASKATLMNMDKYFMWIHHAWLHNHNKVKHNKTVCIFLGIYCMLIHINMIRNCDQWWHGGLVTK